MSRLLRSAACTLLLALPARISAQPLGPPVATWQPNGAIRALALDGHMLYAGGEFDVVGPTTGSFTAVAANDATSVTAGTVSADSTLAVAADGANGWFIATSPPFGSTFNVLHVRADGSQDPGWTPPVFGTFSSVNGLVVDGGRLFVAGGFATVNGVSRPGLVALDPASGAVLPWDARLVSIATVPPSTFPPAVFTMAAAAGRLYVYGAFQSAGGAARNRFAVLDSATGDALPGTLPPETQFVTGIAVSATRVFVSGDCLPNRFVVCGYDAQMTPLPTWSFPGQSIVGPLAAGPAALYSVEPSAVGPPFGVKLVARDLDTGVALPFADPVILGSPGVSVNALAATGNTVYLGGDFTTVNGQRRWRAAAVDGVTGALQPWAPLVGGQVRALAASGGAIGVGGFFRVAGGVAKRNLIALDLRTGRPGRATPDLAFNVAALLQLGGAMVVGGDRPFGATGPDLTAFTTIDGALLPWALESNGAISTLATDGRRLYLGGRFSSLSGALRLNLAAVDLATATLTAWNPQPDAPVLNLTVDGPTLFAAGIFNSLKGYGRPGVAAFDTASLGVLSFGGSAPPAGPNFSFAPGRVLLAGVDYNFPYGAGPLTWRDRISGAPVAPVGINFNVGATARFDGTEFLAGNTATGTSTLLGIESATGRMRAWDLAIDYQASVRIALAVNADYIALGSGAPFLSTSRLAVHPAPRAGAPQQMQSAVTGNTVTLGWQPGGAPATAAFIVEAGTTAGGTNVGVFNVGLSTRVSGTLAPGTYFIRVRGVGANGAGTASSEVVATVPSTSTPPAAPGTLSASVSGNVVTLSWGAAAGNATAYVIEAGTAAGLTNIGALPTGHLDTTWSVPAPAGTYFVRVRAANTFGLSAPTNEVTVVVP